jgi:hypothetical protein
MAIRTVHQVREISPRGDVLTKFFVRTPELLAMWRAYPCRIRREAVKAQIVKIKYSDKNGVVKSSRRVGTVALV